MVHLVVILALVAMAAATGCFFRWIWRRPSRLRSAVQKLALLFFSLSFVLVALELFFMFFVAQSDGMANTLASRNWFKRYWKPMNSEGFRDVERRPEDLYGKRVVVLTGDSFAEGHGIEKIEDRFSNVMEKELGPEWAVVNRGKGAWDSTDEYKGVQSFQGPMEFIVLSYYLNDVDGAAEKFGFWMPQLVPPPPAWIKPLVDHSHLANFFYWRVYRFRNANEMERIYWDYLAQCYNAPHIWQLHEGELQKFISLAAARKAKLLVVIFPNLLRMDFSRPFTQRVQQFFLNQGVQAVDLSTILDDEEPRSLIVNSVDTHPNRTVHHRVGKLLADMVRRSLEAEAAKTTVPKPTP